MSGDESHATGSSLTEHEKDDWCGGWANFVSGFGSCQPTHPTKNLAHADQCSD